MKYTWGYIKESVLAKLDIDQTEALERGLINKMPYYANEALLQICSTIKPKHVKATFDVITLSEAWSKTLEWAKQNGLVLPKAYYDGAVDLAPTSDDEKKFVKQLEKLPYLMNTVCMPEDFLAFDDNAPTIIERKFDRFQSIVNGELREATDEDFSYVEDNKLTFYMLGKFEIYYKAVWCMFTSTTKDSTELDVPLDILNCLPSYIASQLYKVDDEVKAQIYRNEYELLFSRIDDTYFKRPETIKIRGGW